MMLTIPGTTLQIGSLRLRGSNLLPADTSISGEHKEKVKEK